MKKYKDKQKGGNGWQKSKTAEEFKMSTSDYKIKELKGNKNTKKIEMLSFPIIDQQILLQTQDMLPIWKENYKKLDYKCERGKLD